MFKRNNSPSENVNELPKDATIEEQVNFLLDEPGDPERDAKKERYQKQMNTLNTVILIVLAVLCVAVIAFKFIVRPVHISGDSMLPTFKNDDYVMTSKNVSTETVIRGTVVVFRGEQTGGNYYIKRVVGIPGDTLQIINGKLYINGEKETTAYDDILKPGILTEETLLGDGEFFCMGDNRNHSLDCREFGPITLDEITGIVVKRIFPLESFGKQP